MNVKKIDCIWAVLSFITVGVSFHMGYLLYGLLMIFGSQVLLYGFHIWSMNRRIKRTVAVFGTVTDYRTVKGVGTHYYPVVNFETEDGMAIDSVYNIACSGKKYEIGDEIMICYDPDDPVFFYFADSVSELTDNYFRCMMFCGVPGFVLALLAIIVY